MEPIRNIEELIRNKLHVTAGSALHDRVLARIRHAQEQYDETTPALTEPLTRRTIMKGPIVKFAAAVVIIIVVLIGIHQIGGGGSVVFAQVAQQLRNARTMTYSVVTCTPLKNMPTVRTEIAFKEPAYMRTTTADGFVTVIDWTEVRGISIWPSRKQFIEFEASNYRHDPAQDPFMVIEKLRALPCEADEVLGEKEIDGRVLQGFRVSQENVTNSVWVDPQTGQLVRVEMEFTDAPGMNKIMTDFQFNVELDDSLFSLTPPDGFTRLGIQADVSTVTEQDLIEYLQMWSTWTKDGTFPPTFNPIELPKVTAEMIKQGEFGEGETSEQQRHAEAMQMYRGIMFVAQLPAESNWRYAGENVRYGDVDTPIFWYRPKDSETYRVIYGDLSVRDVAAGDLPK